MKTRDVIAVSFAFVLGYFNFNHNADANLDALSNHQTQVELGAYRLLSAVSTQADESQAALMTLLERMPEGGWSEAGCAQIDRADDDTYLQYLINYNSKMRVARIFLSIQKKRVGLEKMEEIASALAIVDDMEEIVRSDKKDYRDLQRRLLECGK